MKVRGFSFGLLVLALVSTVFLSGFAQSRLPDTAEARTDESDAGIISFTGNPEYPAVGQPVKFSVINEGGAKGALSWKWDFGDGKSSSLQNPRHAFVRPGFYSVSLMSITSSGLLRGRRTISVRPRTVASFSYSPVSPKVGQSVQFTDATTAGPTSWKWDFGDGATLAAQNAVHKYKAAGSYTVTLVAGVSSSTDTARKTLTVKAPILAPPLTASFTYNPGSSAPGQAIQFTDTSAGSPTAWWWNFNDGETSAVQNPTHTFAVAGNYHVTLMVTNSSGSNSAGLSIVIGSEDAGKTGSSSEEIRAASPSLEDVKAAIAKAKAGDRVMVPSGKTTWNGQLALTKGVKLIGAGAGSTVITSGYVAPTLYDSTGYLIAYLPDSPGRDEPFRLSGFTFDLAGKCQWITIQNRTTSAIRQLRIDHNSVSGSSKRNIVIRGAVYGVIDNNELTGGLMLTAYGSNATSWNNFTFDFGTADNIYFEDNTCTISMTPHDGGVGGRYCARFNKYIYVNQAKQLVPWFDMHGNQGLGKNWAGMGVEIYENVLEGGERTAMIAAIRGGKALVFNNKVKTTTRTKAWNRVREEYDDSLNPPAVDPISGQPQHVSDTYFWGNYQNGTLVMTSIGETIDYAGKAGIVPRRNVHFWDQTLNFDGTSGVGVGPLARRPAKGVAGVCYWATDTKKLYRWSKAGKWDEFYTPYPYPHPLRGVL